MTNCYELIRSSHALYTTDKLYLSKPQKCQMYVPLNINDEEDTPNTLSFFEL